MAHIFISYSSKNQVERDELYNFLLQNGFTSGEIWVDRAGIEAGDNWVEAIDEGLENAFAVLVVATEEAMNSHYVTYEWSWAISRQIPVIPIIFDGRPPNFHRRLEKSVQCFDWVREEREDLRKTLVKLKRLSPLFLYSQRIITNELMPARVLITMSLWIHEYAKIGLVDYDAFRKLFIKTMQELKAIHYEKLPKLGIQYFYALNVNQRKHLEALIEGFDELWDCLYLLNEYLVYPKWNRAEYENDVKTYFSQVNAIWNDKIRPLFDYFDPYLMEESAFARFDIARKLIAGRVKPNAVEKAKEAFIYSEIGSFFSIEDADMIYELVEKVKQHKFDIEQAKRSSAYK